MNYNQKKITSLIAFIFILLSLIIIIFTGVAEGYEISIYDIYPTYFWLFLIISTFCGFIIMVTDSFSDNESQWWKVGFFIVLFSNLIILLLPLFRGYFTFGRGDVLSHIGYSLDIINSGHFTAAGASGENYYPVLHIIMSSIAQITGLNLELIAQTLPILFIFFYMISIYLLSKEITKDNKKSILITAFASVLMFKTENLMLAPSVQAFFILPFLLLIFYKAYSNKKESLVYSAILVLMLILLPFFHPGEGSVYLIPLFIGIYLSFIFYRRFGMKDNSNIKTGRNLVNVILILFVTWATWFFSFSAFGRKAGKIADWVIYQSGNTNIDQVSDLLITANLSTIQFLNLLIHSYGQQLIYIALGFVIALIIYITLIYLKKPVDLDKFIFSNLFFIFIGLAIVSFVGYTGVDSFRGLRYVLFVSTILIGTFAYDFVKKMDINYRKYGITLIISVLMVSSIIGLFNTYGSSETKSVNFQVTKMEMVGDNWLLDNRNKSLFVESITPKQLNRFSAAILGSNGAYINHRFKLKISPTHFNYTNTNNYGASLVKDEYYVDWKLSRIFYPNIYPEYENVWKYTSKDFDYLDNMDNSVNPIYSNGEFWVYYINSK